MASLKIGMIAPEFPPDVGGMATLARGYADELARSEELTVFTHPGVPVDQSTYPVSPLINNCLAADHAALAAAGDIDAWLALNGGLIPLAARLEQPFFVYLHGSDFLNPWISYGSAWLEGLRRPYMAELRKMLRRAALRRHVGRVRHIFANSRRTAELAVDTLRVSPSKISVCAPGVDDQFFQAHTPRSGNGSQRLRLLTVTRLTKHSARKNVDGVLEAVAMLADRIDIEYTIVGDGDDRARLETKAAELGIGKRVRFAGRVDDEQLLACYRNADLFVLAAKATARDIEGFGIVYLEASASGVPVICSRSGGAIDAVTEGENGILIPDSSAAAIAAGIAGFTDERARYTAERARAVAERYRWQRVGEDLRKRLHAELAAGAEA